VSRVPLASVPATIKLEKVDAKDAHGIEGDLYRLIVPGEEKGTTEPAHAGRLLYDGTTHELITRGVLPPFAMMQSMRPTVDQKYLDSIDALEAGTKSASPEKPVTLKIGPLAPDYQMPLALEKKGEAEPIASKWTA